MSDTIKYYDNDAKNYFDKSLLADVSHLYSEFIKLLPPGENSELSILDAGCGSGRDTKAFVEMGYDVTAIDASIKMCEVASNYTGIAVENVCLEDYQITKLFDGIWACAVLLHIERQRLKGIMEVFSNSLKPNGIMYVSFKYGDSDRVEDGRHFTDMTELSLQELVAQVPELCIQKLWITNDSAGRDNSWVNAIMSIEKVIRKRNDK
jgi:SAM-dependent methyltransferase